MTCIIVEDQLPAQRVLKKYIADMGTLDLKGTFTNAVEALPILSDEKIDLMFLDIHLPKLSGMDFLKSLSNPPQVILTTAFPDYALESYELNVVDYLLKPFSFQRFLKAVSKVSTDNNSVANSEAGNEVNQNRVEELFLKSGYDHIKIKVNDIHYIKSDSDYTEIHLKAKKHLSSEPLKYWEDTLDSKQFMRIHKSYIVNTSKIKKVSGNRIYLENEAKLPIGRAYKSEFTERFIG